MEPDVEVEKKMPDTMKSSTKAAALASSLAAQQAEGRRRGTPVLESTPTALSGRASSSGEDEKGKWIRTGDGLGRTRTDLDGSVFS